MTDFTINLVDAIISGRATDIETAFQEAITDKISIAMETRRTEIAQSMFKESAEQLDEISAEKIVKYSEKSNKEYNDPSTSDEKKALRRKGLMLGYNKMKARAKVPATSEEFALEDYSLEELEDFMMSEDFEQLDELSKATLGSYVKKASGKLASHGTNLMGSVGNFNIKNAEYHGTKIDKRQKGISKAVDKLSK
jgi:hypothetical protein